MTFNFHSRCFTLNVYTLQHALIISIAMECIFYCLNQRVTGNQLSKQFEWNLCVDDVFCIRIPQVFINMLFSTLKYFPFFFQPFYLFKANKWSLHNFTWMVVSFDWQVQKLPGDFAPSINAWLFYYHFVSSDYLYSFPTILWLFSEL